MKNTKFLYLAVVFLSTILVSFAQNSNRIFKKFTQKEQQFLIEVNDGVYQIQFFTPEIVETTFVPKGEELFVKKSYAVVLTPQQVEVEVFSLKGVDTIKSKGLKVVIQRQPFQLKYYYKDQEIISEKQGYFKSKHQPMDMVKDNIIARETEKISFHLTVDEVLYGGGARALNMNRRGYRLPLYNKAHYGYETHSELMNYTLPLVLSSKNYAIHFDNAPIGYLDLDSKNDNTLTYETISGRKTYQIIAGATLLEVVSNYTNLTGKQPMLPRWALGNFSSRFGYHSQKETENTIAKFKKEKIPVDAIILDLYWFGKDIKGTMGNLEVFKDSFPDMSKMIKDFTKKGVKTVLITEPFVLTSSKKWKEAVSKKVLAKDSIKNPARYDFYFGNTGIIDIYSKKGNSWFKNIYKGLFKMGVTGVWGDLGEPEVLPSWVNFTNGTADEVHNIYGHDWAKLVYESFREYLPHQRPFILMRAGYSGTQRYGIVPWSGDVNRTWGGLQSQPKIALQMGLQGLAYMHSDLGGFAGDLEDDELYVRWLQYGVFQPIFRPHAQEEIPSEPIFRSEKAKQLAKKAIELRYQLLPYNYELMFENHRYGIPLMRPIFTDFLEDSVSKDSLNTYSETYLWGNDILVSPVLEKGKKTQEVYFPNNSNWFDFYTHRKIKGGQIKEVFLEEDKIPTYIRGGAFIPMAKSMQNTEEYSANTWNIHYYYDKNSVESYRKFYNDNGITPQAYKKGLFEIIEFKAKQKEHLLQITLKAEIGENNTSQIKNYTFIIHGLQHFPKKIKVGELKTNFIWDEELKILKFTVNWDTKTDENIEVSTFSVLK